MCRMLCSILWRTTLFVAPSRENRLTLQCDALPLAQVDHETTPPPPSAKQQGDFKR